MNATATSASTPPGAAAPVRNDTHAPTRRALLIGATAAASVLLAAPALGRETAAVADPLIELELRYLAAAEAFSQAVDAAEDARWHQAPAKLVAELQEVTLVAGDELTLVNRALSDSVPVSPAGAGVLLRRLLEAESPGGDDTFCWEYLLALLTWVGSLTGRSEFGPVMPGCEV